MKFIIGCGAAILENNKLLLTKRVSSKKKFPNCWTFPAGRLEETDGSVKEAAIRELKEEVNLDFVPKEKLGFYEIHWKDKIIFSFVFLGDWSGDLRIQEEEISEFGWFSYEETKKLKLAFSYSEAIEDLHKKELLK
jgi:8-oxo-dGTP diphosphatase